MKTNMKAIWAAAAVALSLGLTACSDANEYADTDVNNPSFGETYPDSLDGTTWVRGKGIKVNAMGEEVQGYVDTLKFVSADSVYVKMAEGASTDDSNTAKLPLYEYAYSNKDGVLEIKKRVVDEKKNVSKQSIFIGRAITGSPDVIVVCHYGDTPVQTYMVKL